MRHRIFIHFFAALSFVLTASEPVRAQTTQPIVVGQPISTPTFTVVAPNPVVPQDFSQGATSAVTTTKVTLSPAPVIIGAVFSPPPNGSCSPKIPSTMIVQDCTLGNTSFESNLVNMWVGVHGLSQSDASLIYQYGGIDVRSEIRSFMLAYLQGVINETPAQLAANPNDQAAFTWLQNAIKQNEIAYYGAAVNEYKKWMANPCQYQLNTIVASKFGLSYNGAPYCGASLTGVFQSAQAPDVSYFKEVGQLTAYDNKIGGYDGTVANSAVTGAQILLQAQEQVSKWSALAALGPSIAVGAGVGGVVAGNIGAIAPFAAYAGDFATAGQVPTALTEAAAAEAAETAEEAAEVGSAVAGADVLGAAGVVAIFVEIGVVAVIDLVQTDQNQAAIANLISVNNTIASQTPNLKAMLGDQVGIQKIVETFIAATLPDLPSTQGVTTPPIPPQDNPSDVFVFVDHTFGLQTGGNEINYLTWDPKYPYNPTGTPPFAQYGNSITAYSYGDGLFLQTPAVNNTSTFLSPTIKYIDFTSGIHYIADRIDKGRFLVSKAPDQVTSQDYICPVNKFGVIPYTTIPTNCSSFVTTYLNVIRDTYDYQTVTIPQPPVFSTPSSFNFTIGGTAYQVFSPHLDGSSSPWLCEITAGTLPPGFVFTNNQLYIQVPPLASPGGYPITFTGNCDFVPGYSTIYGNAQTTQVFTAIVSNVAGTTGTANVRISRDSTTPQTGGTTLPLQFTYPASNTSFAFTQGRATTLTVTTNGGSGTTITAGGNALPPGLTLTDNGNGTALIAGTPTGPFPACASACAITASAPGLTNATLTLNASVVAPQLPNILASQNVNWAAGQNNAFTIDGSLAASGSPTSVALSWSAVGALPSWATLTDNGNNIVTFAGVPPVSAVNQTIALQYKYVYGGTAGFSSPVFTVNIVVGAPTPLLSVHPILLFQVGVSGSGTVNSSTASGAAGLGGSFQINGTLPTGLTSSQSGTSLTISGTPVNPGNFLIPVQFSAGGLSTTRNVALMIAQPASLSSFPARLVLFAGVPAKIILPVTTGFPQDSAGSPGDGLPSTTGTNLSLSPGYSGGNGLTLTLNGASLNFTGTPIAAAPPASFTVSAQTQLSTGPVGGQVSQPFTLYVQLAGDVNLDGVVNCLDYDLIKAHYGAMKGQANYLDLADPNHDGLVNILDLAFVQSHLPAGTVCQ